MSIHCVLEDGPMENNAGHSVSNKGNIGNPTIAGHSRRFLRPLRFLLFLAVFLLGVTPLSIANSSNQSVPVLQSFSDLEGQFANYNAGGPTDTTVNAFFQDLGTNGRRCVTCHQASDAWSVIPSHIQTRFNATHGTDPIFRTNDGSGCPTQDVSTEDARRQAYSLLLSKGLIRIEQQVPVNAE